MSSEKDGLFNVIIVDSTANKIITSVFARTFKDFYDKYDVLEKGKIIILSAMTDRSDEWHENFLKSFKEKVLLSDPAVYVEVALYGTADDDFKLLLVSEHDDIVNKLKVVTKSVETTTGLESEVQLINGGLWLMQDDFKASHPYSPDDYDKTSPLEQWKSQHPLGLQTITQMETKGPLSKEWVRNLLVNAMTSLSVSSLDLIDEEIQIQEYDDLGDGCVLMATWSEGSVFVLWDGRGHVDINLFAYEGIDEEESKSFNLRFQSDTSLRVVLYDEHPRGFGRVVNYKHEFDPDVEPHWS
mmetsp:Transcript_6365/g.8375  ORF Transcript_6365/g.8375 Transcript_6365/m.8375 type:complete len:298 (+) Transcript_6365:1-894(+)